MHEDEFRVIVFLGGRKVIQLSIDCIKNVYLGCNMTNENIVSIIHIMSMLSMRAGLYKMVRLKNGGLAPRNLNWQNHIQAFKSIETELNGFK